MFHNNGRFTAHFKNDYFLNNNLLRMIGKDATTGKSKKKKNMVKKLIFSCNLFQKVKLSYILASLHIK